jgi:Asp/Glu/hydantoin racemase
VVYKVIEQANSFSVVDQGGKDLLEPFIRGARELRETAVRLVRDNPDVGAILLECTNMPPYSAAIQEATGLPVFDVITLINYVHAALRPRPYAGYL